MTTSIEIRSTDATEQSYLRFYRAALIRRGYSSDAATKAIAKGTAIQIKGRAFAELLTQVFYNERALEDAQMPDTATGDDLVRLAAQVGIAPLAGSGAAGDVVVTCTGTVTYSAGAELVSAKNGKRYRVVASTIASNGDAVGVIGFDVGRATNLASGEILTWVSPPGGSASTATVGIAGLTNGQEPDDDARLRTRLLKRLQNPPGAGNWAQMRQWAEEANASVEAAYVYPAVHGPGTVQIAIVVEGTADNLYYRSAPAALVTAVRDAVLSQAPEPMDVVVDTVLMLESKFACSIVLPEPVSAGGPGGGWIDAARWPAPLASLAPRITTVITASVFICNATTSPVDGSHVAIWDSGICGFRHAVIVSHSGSSGAYVITLDQSFPTLSVGAYISPDCENIDAYGAELCEQYARLGPGQRTFSTGRQQRHPLVSSSEPAGISGSALAPILLAHGEIASLTVNTLGGSSGPGAADFPSNAASLNESPRILYPAQIGFYDE